MRQTVTYGVLGEYLKVHPHHELSQVLRYIRDEICAIYNSPSITSIVIGKNTDRPSDGFFVESLDGLTEDEILHKYEQFRDEAFMYTDWDDLLSQLDLKPLQVTDQDLDREAEEYNRFIERSGGRGEQVQHRLLKDFIAAQPQIIGIDALGKPTTEYLFKSDDRCDILVELFGQCAAIIEIKVGQRGELVKGIYQLVKYGALLVAERGHGQPYPVELHLVAYTIPSDISDFAEKFAITCHCVPGKQVHA
jgi:hypothetical protein